MPYLEHLTAASPAHTLQLCVPDTLNKDSLRIFTWPALTYWVPLKLHDRRRGTYHLLVLVLVLLLLLLVLLLLLLLLLLVLLLLLQ